MSEKEDLQQQEEPQSGRRQVEEASSDRKAYIFAEASVGKAVTSMIAPTIVSQIILVVYNLADTWYVGLTENAAAVAAVSLCLPVYNILSAISNLFGIGGAGALARALGVNDHDRAKRLLVLSIGGALAGAALYALLMGIFDRPLLLLIGGNTDTIDYAVTYVFWTIVVGGNSHYSRTCLWSSDPCHGASQDGQLRNDSGMCAEHHSGSSVYVCAASSGKRGGRRSDCNCFV